MSVDIVDWQEKMHYIDDALGVCAGLSSFPLKPPYHIHNYPHFISSATGIDMDEAKLTQIYNRNRNLIRAINVRRGLRRADEKPPEDHWKKRFPELEEKLLDAYYKFKGWNNHGIPTKKSLQELDLAYVAEDLEQRGIIKNEPKLRRKSRLTRRGSVKHRHHDLMVEVGEGQYFPKTIFIGYGVLQIRNITPVSSNLLRPIDILLNPKKGCLAAILGQC